eukprot:scaffold55214_cov30-Tisochrysis_lutea.AAC.1
MRLDPTQVRPHALISLYQRPQLHAEVPQQSALALEAGSSYHGLEIISVPTSRLEQSHGDVVPEPMLLNETFHCSRELVVLKVTRFSESANADIGKG